MADVLLSLKNAVLKPSPEPHSYHQSSSQSLQGYGNNSHAMHPQMLLSPTHHHIHHHYHQNQSQNVSTGGYYDTPSSCSGQHYPSMSVNVSMNMTMHGGSVEGPMVILVLILQNTVSLSPFQIDFEIFADILFYTLTFFLFVSNKFFFHFESLKG